MINDRARMALLFALLITACNESTSQSNVSNNAGNQVGTNVNKTANTDEQQELVSSTVEQTTVEQTTVEQTGEAIVAGKDYHSLSNPEQVSIKHLHLDLTIDFERKVMSGYAEFEFIKHDTSAQILILDTSNLEIKSVSTKQGELAFILKEADPVLGAALEIELPQQGNIVRIDYTTSPDASGVQWLTPAQTAGGQYPFIFTQAQATHARSFIPLQDTPQVRMTYTATIRTPKELLAVMSASNDPDAERDGVYEFDMPQPIPSYLMALAVGDLQFKAIGERTGVYAEPALLEAAAAEFEDTESMLIATEEQYGPYDWDRYDLLILPPSFPFGGMENPRLSFITPTVIAGDKSLVSLIAHELAHSWSGNTVTNATWRDLWLNEGFTTYLTYRIMEIIYGTNRYKMEAVLGYEDLEQDIEELEAQDQILAIDLRGRHPDDVFSNIPYEKGALFLREIETRIGRDHFDAFLTRYFKKFAFKSITTDQFIHYLEETLLVQHGDKLDINRINQWIFEPGIPENTAKPESNAFTRIDAIRMQWLNGRVAANNIDTTDWTVHEWLYFLNNLPEKLSDTQMGQLDSAFKLTASNNNEVAHSWLLMSVRNWYEPALGRLHDYLVSIGRNKLIKPLYKELAKTDKGKALGRKAFAQAKPSYHPLTVKANQEFVQ